MKKTFSRLSVVLISLLLVLEMSVPAFALSGNISNKGEIMIRNVNDLIEMSAHCRLDTWSRGKTFVLCGNISLKDVDFSPIPTFGGIFEGNGYIISDFTLNRGMAPAGLFANVQECGKIKDLNVVGNIATVQDSTMVGGIAGRNYGIISGCSFSGQITGNTNIGGIVGVNQLSGKIADCKSKGKIIGKECTGGIAGMNKGSIEGCTNQSSVNIESMDPEVSIEDLEIPITDNILDLTRSSSYNIIRDTGGIAGLSSGWITNCTNDNTIGHIHIGYNTGGIVGRNSGYLAHCKNNGDVLARKDAGGIAGQAEPYIVVNLGEDNIKNLYNEIEELNKMVDSAIDNAESSVSLVSSDFTQLNQRIETAEDNANTLSKKIIEFGDSTIAEINRESQLLSETMRSLYEVWSDTKLLDESIDNSLKYMEYSISDLNEFGDLAADAVHELKLSSADLEEAADIISTGASELRGMSENLLSDKAKKRMQREIDKAKEKESEGKEVDWAEVFEEIFEDIDLDDINMQVLIDMIQRALEDIEEASKYLESGMNHVKKAMEYTEKAMPYLNYAFDDMQSSIRYIETVNDELQRLIKASKLAVEPLIYADPMQFASPDDMLSEANDELYASLKSVGVSLENVNTDIEESAVDFGEELKDINGQFMKVMNSVAKVLELLTTGGSIEPVVDMSDEDIAKTTSGKIYASENSGRVEGDINVGGVAGALGIEVEFDPEDDLTSELTGLGDQQFVKVILQNCKNYGEIRAKRDCAASIAGRMEMGYITGCEAYGSACSETTDYVGGICGLASGRINGCYAKCCLEGRNYIGGIVGSCSRENTDTSTSKVMGCTSLVSITDSVQYYGAIAGGEPGEISGNIFVSDELGGVNGVSYQYKAEPVFYDELIKNKNIPVEFKRFKVEFKADDEILASETLKYGEAIKKCDYPDIPEKEGYYGEWSIEELENVHFDTVVEVNYFRLVSALESTDYKREGRPVLFVEGNFTSKDSLVTAASTASGTNVEERWVLGIPDDGNSTHYIRYRLPEKVGTEYAVYVYDGQKWSKAKTEEIGSYQRFEVKGNDVSIELRRVHLLLFQVMGFAALCLILAAVVIRQMKLSKRNKSR